MKRLSPAQLQLLREVGRGEVKRSGWPPCDSEVYRAHLARYVIVNRTVKALEQRGLVELGEEDGVVRRRSYWRLTDAGREALGVGGGQ